MKEPDGLGDMFESSELLRLGGKLARRIDRMVSVAAEICSFVVSLANCSSI